MQGKPLDLQKGFTIVEMLVAIALFTVVLTASTGALFAIIAANRKAQAFDSGMSNVSFVMDHMTRNLRVGTTYVCFGGTQPSSVDVQTPRNCPLTSSNNYGYGIAFERQRATDGNATNQWVYRYNTDVNGGFIERCKASCSTSGISGYTRMTAENVNITGFSVYVNGATVGDTEQPRIFLQVEGTVRNDSNTAPTKFSLQTTITQRLFDI